MKYNLDKQLYIVFIALVIIAITNAVVITYNTEKSNRISIEITEVTSPTVTTLAEMDNLVARSRMYVTNWVYVSTGQSDKESLLRLNTIEYPRLRIRLTRLSNSWKNPDHSAHLRQILDQYDKIVAFEQEIGRTLVTPEDYQDPLKQYASEEILQSNIIPASRSLASNLERLIRIKNSESEFRHHDMQMAFFIMKAVLINLAIFIILAVLFMTYYVTNKFLKPVLNIREIILLMGRGELPKMSLSIPRNTVGEMAIALRSLIDSLKRTSTFANEIGKANFSSHFQPLSEGDVLGKSLIEMRDKLRTANEEDAVRNWTTEGIALISNVLQKHTSSIQDLTDSITETVVNYVGVHQAAIFLVDSEETDKPSIRLSAHYSLNRKIRTATPLELGEGLVGQAIVSNRRIHLDNLKDPYFTIESGLGSSKACSVLILPLYAGGQVLGAMEVASLHTLSEVKIAFLEKIAEPLAMNIFTVRSNTTTKTLLAESIKQADELTAQKQEMRWANEELVNKSKQLERSQTELETQQQELKKAYAELEMKAQLLQEQNLVVEEARQSLSFKAQQLEQSNKYKSAFLANMSHELRTPLNSVLILARILAENKAGNLHAKQIEHARVIFKSGNDLLTIINDILDFSKIEAGKIELHKTTVETKEIAENMNNLFSVIATEKGIDLSVAIGQDFPASLTTDRIRLEQVIKNLLSNALKFTGRSGKVSMRFGLATKDALQYSKTLSDHDRVLAISVSDTGIGIPEDKQKIVFEAFKQVDASNSRKYGGTGLGLAISRELCQLLGGDLTLHSVEGSGSTFTVFLPDIPWVEEEAVMEPADEHATGTETANPDFCRYAEHEIADDRNDIQAGDRLVLIIEDDTAFARTLQDAAREYGFKTVVATTGEDGLRYARHFSPDRIVLDMKLPGIDGWSVLKKLKQDDSLSHIPVYITSASDKWAKGLKMGAADYITKPCTIEDLYKLFVEHPAEDMPAIPAKTAPDAPAADGDDGTLQGRTILMADDDMRNVYSLSAILQDEGLHVVVAHDGKDALEKLKAMDNVDMILMDIMMPEMDGYTAIRAIRRIDRFKKTPILAITAKAMKEDRQKCLDAGATEYVAKPVKTDVLLAAMKKWMPRRANAAAGDNRQP